MSLQALIAHIFLVLNNILFPEYTTVYSFFSYWRTSSLPPNFDNYKECYCKHPCELPCCLSGISKESTCQCRRQGFDSWVGKIPWRRKWQPTPVFLPGKSHGQRSLAGSSPWGHKRVRHDLATKQLPYLGFCVNTAFQLLWISTKVWDCWIIWWEYA